MKSTKAFLCLVLAFAVFIGFSENFSRAAESGLTATNFLNETPAQKAARLKWWSDARFGLFIHWGVYSVPAGVWNGHTNYAEWFLEQTHMPVSQYEKFADQFDPTNFNALAWVKAAKYAGMKYIVITSKHHDGFGMFRSDLTDWCIKRTPFQRDPLKELAAACKDEGVRFCLYYSIMDWHSADWPIRRPWNDVAPADHKPDMDAYVAYMKGQLKELLTRYGPIGLLWFDGEWESPWTPERGADLYNYVRSLQPQIIVNNRVGKARAGMAGMNKTAGVGDYGTPEQTIPPTGFGPGVYWESCMTMNDHWGYNRDDQDFKSTKTLVHNLIDCASKGGNYLLNVGPTSQGIIPAPELERLKEIGDWMRVNGDSIYGTSASPFKKLSWGRCTQKADGGDTLLYLHVWDWPADGKLFVPGLENQIRRAYLLKSNSIGWHKHLKTENSADGVTVLVPANAPSDISSTVVLEIKGAPEVAATFLKQNADGSITLRAVDADLHGGLRYEIGNGKDDIGYWTDPNDFASWTFKVNSPGRFRVTVATAAQGEGQFEISVAGQKISGAAPKTGDYTNFQTTHLPGVLEIPANGEATLTIRPVKENWSPVNLKSITLTPAGM